MNESLSVTHNSERNRFETTVEQHTAYVEYDLEGEQGKQMVVTHTIVPQEVAGRGIAQALVKFALDHARERNMKVRPQCSYMAKYIERHPEYSDLVIR